MNVPATAARRSRGSVIEASAARLDAMARARPVLLAPWRAAAGRHACAPPAERDAFAEAVLRLANVNAGAAALMAALRLAATTAPGALPRATGAALAAADLCRKAGAAATQAAFNARLDLAPRLANWTAADEAAWWRGLVRLSREAPDCVPALAAASGAVLDGCGAANFEGFVAAGLRSGTDRGARLSFFALRSPEARRVLDRLGGAVTLSRLGPQLKAYATALWGRPFPIKELPPAADMPASARRAAVSSGIVLVPDVFRGVPRAAASDLYRATVAHATAHLALGAVPFDPGHLKPVQVALVGLVEDARVEALAMRRLPGLRALWAPFHTVEPSHLKTAPAILARVARALFDPEHADDDGVVAKARALFGAEPDLADPGLSRRIGGLIGNDIGQMRVQFDAKSHVVEPRYRDDNLGLWALPPPPPDAALQGVDVAVQAVRMEHRPDGDDDAPPDPDDPERREGAAGRARPIAPDARGIAVARTPEWDRAAGLERPDWCTIREAPPALGDPAAIDDALARDVGLARRVERLVREARVGRPTRLRRQPDGLDLDIDAAIEAVTALRAGELPEDRIHTRKVLRARDLAALVLVDVSESTRDRVPGLDASVLDVETRAVAVLADAMDRLGDRLALRAFASDGRDAVRLTRIKDFDGAFDGAAKARLAGLAPGHSTRLGAALRHAGAELAAIAATRRLVLVLTDGAPSDVDVPDPADLVEDARRAVLSLRGRGVDVFGITLDPSGQGAGASVFGRANHMPVRRIEDLPARLSDLYFRIARR
ncbi:nitric oxide reductase activation protein NorD [Lichenibacterium dinghuense]|uniref:nitric oxide reductase activation protein NorD n=1 Tax=Lichenibacterium dinghuense TaxID=2895977 RepID=UPI001F462B71|nr:VWA domain-containing protein [Lichenibacterium sp. 6Y81]